MKILILLAVLLLSTCTFDSVVMDDSPRVKLAVQAPREVEKIYRMYISFPDEATQDQETDTLLKMYKKVQYSQVSIGYAANHYIAMYRDSKFFDDLVERYAEILLNRGYNYLDVLASIVTLPSESKYVMYSHGAPYDALYNKGNCYTKTMASLVLADHYLRMLPDLAETYGNKREAKLMHDKIKLYIIIVSESKSTYHTYVGINVDFRNLELTKSVSRFDMVYPAYLVRKYVFSYDYEGLFKYSTYSEKKYQVR